MRDPRVDRLAALVAGYSLELREGEILRIDGSDCAAPLLVAFYREALAVGALPYTDVSISCLEEILLENGSDEQIEYLSPTSWNEIETVDAIVTIWAD